MRDSVWIVFLLAATLVFAGCAPSPDAAPAPTADAAPAPAAPAAPVATADTPPLPLIEPIAPTGSTPDAPRPRAPGAPVADGERTFEFWFSAKTEEDDPRVVDWLEDPCGMTPIAVVDSIPLDDPYLQPDFVVEFDAAGKELHRWGKPFSAEILGIAGDELLFRAPHGGGRTGDFRADTGGRLVRSTATIESMLAGASEVECPPLQTFAGSDYVQCYEVADADGRKRRIAWEGACT